ncbi:hypothetical protein, partial [Marinilabilia sp.]|uniref:hypothetical protein n=1 Tax=Marinilabilia sp. TaxID=2021252 RepID=UPI0025B7A7C5
VWILFDLKKGQLKICQIPDIVMVLKNQITLTFFQKGFHHQIVNHDYGFSINNHQAEGRV